MLLAAFVVSLAGLTAQASVNCRSYYIGAVLYTSCDGQAGQPARPRVTVDTSIYKQLESDVKPVNIGDVLHQAAQTRLLREQTALLQEQRRALEAQRLAREAQRLEARPVAAPTAPVLADPAIIDGRWWVELQRAAKAGQLYAELMRSTYIRGLFDGVDLTAVVSTESFVDYEAMRGKWLRSGIGSQEILDKLDAFYADPKNARDLVTVAFLIAVRPEPAK